MNAEINCSMVSATAATSRPCSWSPCWAVGVVVEHRLVDRHGQQILHLEGQGLAQHVGRHRGGAVLAHQHAPAGDAEGDLAALEPCGRPELTQCHGDGSLVDDLGVLRGIRWQRDLAEGEHAR
ncbi:hypothetical protein QF046_002560 [Microbacterium sp. W4I4]|uniref:hypothetical protein n=1 Tax=Microbacterium sp. W4I4 TaxID=3042295 RepID=UPI002783BBE1|nr:hypothetical protein [Microbacterium sp. W4I4]MDQ0614919.1 hypothetical protein [Microbacterium sp. W4I4]